MKLTTKIALGGLFIIGFLLWLSFFYIGSKPGIDSNPYKPLIPTEDISFQSFKNGVDVVLLLTPVNSAAYSQERDKWFFKEKITENRQHGEMRAYNNHRGMDYSRFILRSVEKYIKWFRLVLIVWPDNFNPSPSVNVSSPLIKIVPHSQFIPKELLPTYNSELVKYYLDQIPGITEQFVVLNENIFLVKPLELSYFRNPTDGLYTIHTKSTVPVTYGYINDNVFSNTLKVFKAEDLKLDASGPILIDTSITKKLQSEYKSILTNTTTHRFLYPTDYSYFLFYLLYIHDHKADREIKETDVDFVYHNMNDDDLYNQLKSLHIKSKIIYLADEIFKIRQRVGLDIFLYGLYPDVSRLEINAEDYETLGLIIGVGFLVGFISCCYMITRCFGGNIKQKDVQDRQR